jgi:hypothetical protein
MTMTTDTTAIQASKQGRWALIGATTVTMALLGGAAFWQPRPSGEAASPRTTSAMVGTMATIGDMGGLTGPPQAAREAVRMTMWGGLAELYAERERETQASLALVERMGGMAELYRYQAAAARR